MQQAGLHVYLATSKRAIFARRILEHLEFETYFDGIYGSVPSGEHKPELLAHILSERNISPSHSLMVGDRQLESAGADQLVDSTSDLARTVLSMVSGRQSFT